MARLPGPESLGGTPVPQPGGGIASYRVPESGAEAIGRSVSALGDAAARTGERLAERAEEIAKEVKREEERANTLRAEDAFTQLRQRQLDLTVGEQDGFERLRGAAAVNQPVLTQWQGKFDKAAKEISDGLANDDQREKFRKRAGVVRLQFSEGILRHVVRESDVYSKEVLDGTTQTEVRAATASWNDPNAVALSQERITAAIKSQAERNSWPAEYTEAMRLKATGAIHSAVIGQALASNDYVYAQKWYQDHRDEVDANTAKALERAVADGTQKQLAAGYQSQFLAGQNDIRALDALQKAVTADATLDDTRKNALVGRIMGRSEQLRNQVARAEERRERTLQRQIDAVNAITLAGYEPTLEQMTPLINTARGTAMEPMVRQMVATADATRQFRQASPQQQEAYLTQLEAQARKDPSKFDVNVVSRFRTIYERQQQAVRDDPTTFAVRQGIVNVQDAAAAPLDLSKPEAIGPQLQARYDLGRAMSQRYGVALKPLTKEETDLAVSALRKASPEQKSAFFGSLAKASGTDMDGYRAVMGQIAPDDPVTAVAGIYAARGMQSNQGRVISDYILRGQALLNPPKKEDGQPVKAVMPMPKDSELDAAFNDFARDAFAGKGAARNAYLQTARAIYAARQAEDGDFSGELNSRRWRTAMELATGGIERYNGRSIVMPYGYDYARFRTELNAKVEALAKGGQLPQGVVAGDLRGMPLENIGDGRYVFRAGDGVLARPGAAGKNAQPIILDFNR